MQKCLVKPNNCCRLGTSRRWRWFLCQGLKYCVSYVSSIAESLLQAIPRTDSGPPSPKELDLDVLTRSACQEAELTEC